MRIHARLLPTFLALISTMGACAGAQMPATAWTFEQLLQPPTAAELRRVDEEWQRKAWDVRDIKLAGISSAPVAAERFEARLYTYTLNGSRRCGALLLPPHAIAERSMAALLDIGDIRWDYPDRDLTNGPYVGKILADRARDFVLVVPCARGMALRVGNVRVHAEGDRRDAWEGVAEDAIAFLTVALKMTRLIDSSRIGVYGYSRGGGVALIVGQRDPRVKAVLDFAGPTDWFSAMGRPGQNWPHRLQEVSREPELPRDTRESQFLDWFVRDRENLPLAELRRRLLAASPLYFVKRLPAFQIHHGTKDGPVPVRNATRVRDRLLPHDDSRKVFIYDGAGHLLDDTAAFTTARVFLVERIGTAKQQQCDQGAAATAPATKSCVAAV